MSFSEFLSTLAERLKSFPSRRAVHDCFRTYDDNQDGKLDLNEATELIQRIYQDSADNEGSKQDIAERFSNIDVDGNGKIDIDEMHDFMKKLFIFKPFNLQALQKVREENQRKLLRDTVPTQIADLIYQTLTSTLLYYIWTQFAPHEWKDFVHNVYLSKKPNIFLYTYCIFMVSICAIMILKNVLPMYLFEINKNNGFVLEKFVRTHYITLRVHIFTGIFSTVTQGFISLFPKLCVEYFGFRTCQILLCLDIFHGLSVQQMSERSSGLYQNRGCHIGIGMTKFLLCTLAWNCDFGDISTLHHIAMLLFAKTSGFALNKVFSVIMIVLGDFGRKNLAPWYKYWYTWNLDLTFLAAHWLCRDIQFNIFCHVIEPFLYVNHLWIGRHSYYIKRVIVFALMNLIFGIQKFHDMQFHWFMFFFQLAICHFAWKKAVHPPLTNYYRKAKSE